MSGFSWRGRCSSELVVWSSRDGLVALHCKLALECTAQVSVVCELCNEQQIWVLSRVYTKLRKLSKVIYYA